MSTRVTGCRRRLRVWADDLAEKKVLDRVAIHFRYEVDPRSLFETSVSHEDSAEIHERTISERVDVGVARTRSRNEVDQERGWKLFFMLPRMLLHRNPGGGSISRAKLLARFEAFSRGEWIQLVAASEMCDEKAARARRRGARRFQDTIESRTMRAEMLVQFGELAALAPGDNATLTALTNDAKRPSRPREPLPREVVEHVARTPFNLDENSFLRCLRSCRRGAAAGPSRMTSEHLRPLLDDWSSMQVLVKAARRLTALSKRDGGVRGIVAGDVFRRLVARTMAKQLGQAVMKATSPHQYPLSTRAGCECIAHALQGLTEMDPRATVTSIDGVSAFDLISRGALMKGLLQVEGG